MVVVYYYVPVIPSRAVASCYYRVRCIAISVRYCARRAETTKKKPSRVANEHTPYLRNVTAVPPSATSVGVYNNTGQGRDERNAIVPNGIVFCRRSTRVKRNFGGARRNTYGTRTVANFLVPDDARLCVYNISSQILAVIKINTNGQREPSVVRYKYARAPEHASRPLGFFFF